MATPTYELLDSTTLASAASSVTFSSIDQSYGDLVLVIAGEQTANDNYDFYYNSDTSNSSYVYMEGTGSSAGTGSGSNQFGSLSDSVHSSSIHHIMDYSATDKHKTTLVRSNIDQWVIALANRWASTAAITSIELAARGGGNFVSGTTFSLYGIAK